MTPIARQIATHQRRLLKTIDQAIAGYDHGRRLRPALRRAYMACPRHRFLRRYRWRSDGRLHRVTATTLADQLWTIYRNESLIHVLPGDGAAGSTGDLPASTDSEPGFILHLAELLDPRSGHRLLEIGSGGGWLAAMMGHAVGPAGRVTGVEILPALARQSRQSLKSLDMRNVAIVNGDGADGYAADAPYDRVMVTAGTYDLPASLFDQTKEGGLLLVPISNKGGGEEVFLLRKTGDHFRSEIAIPGFYVPLVGKAQRTAGAALRLAALHLWERIERRECLRQRMWLGGRGAADLASRSYRFRSFLSKTEPRFEVFALEAPTAGGPRGFAFGILDEAAESIALCRADELFGYGSPAAAEVFLAAYRRWTELTMPGGASFELTAYPSAKPGVAGPGRWIDRRGDSVFHWQLPN